MRNLVLGLFKAVALPPPYRPDRVWSVPDGRRIYAIGDIHGRLDLLLRLFQELDRDQMARSAARTTLVFLGDLVDRGPGSKGVIDLLQSAKTDAEIVFLAGNHDEVFLRAAEGDGRAAARLHRMGGRETALSYGITPNEFDNGSYDDLAMLLSQRVPSEHKAFLRKMRDWYQAGDYIFVHAGIRPGRPMYDQVSGDMRWIRSGFLDHAGCHGAMIVHGHTVTEAPEFRTNRIGIDTGAFRSGRLTALGLEGNERWLLTT